MILSILLRQRNERNLPLSSLSLLHFLTSFSRVSLSSSEIFKQPLHCAFNHILNFNFIWTIKREIEIVEKNQIEFGVSFDFVAIDAFEGENKSCFIKSKMSCEIFKNNIDLFKICAKNCENFIKKQTIISIKHFTLKTILRLCLNFIILYFWHLASILWCLKEDKTDCNVLMSQFVKSISKTTLMDVAKAQSERFKKVFYPNRNYWQRTSEKKHRWLKNHKNFRVQFTLTFY